MIARYRKSIAALTTGLLGWGAVVVSSKAAAVTASEWLAAGVALATALGVYGVPNEPSPSDFADHDAHVGVWLAQADSQSDPQKENP